MSNDAKLPGISRRGVLKAGGALAATAFGASAVAWPNIVLVLNKVRIVIVPKGLNNPVFKIADLQKPVMIIESGVAPKELAFDVPARQIYAQNNQRQLIVFSPSGDKIKDYSLTKDKTPATVKFLVHPDGRSLLVLVGGTLQWVTLP